MTTRAEEILGLCEANSEKMASHAEAIGIKNFIQHAQYSGRKVDISFHFDKLEAIWSVKGAGQSDPVRFGKFQFTEEQFLKYDKNTFPAMENRISKTIKTLESEHNNLARSLAKLLG